LTKYSDLPSGVAFNVKAIRHRVRGLRPADTHRQPPAGQWTFLGRQGPALGIAGSQRKNAALWQLQLIHHPESRRLCGMVYPVRIQLLGYEDL